ncbi:MAG: BrnA antitoxin family protein [Methylobacteriaceae bacterium]|nr:BrnA antitoxin family protein [Methylobacteriaceae bacterium]
MPEDQIDLRDIPEAPAENWRHALRGIVRVDADVLKWFSENAGRDYSAEINRVLRLYMVGKA